MSSVERFGASDVVSAATAVRRDGAAVVEGVWAPEAIDRLRDAVLRQHPELTDPDRLDDYFGKKGKRFIAPVSITPAISETGIFESRVVEAICSQLLGTDFVYEAFGAIVVYPGIKAQKAHADGVMLFPETGIDKILPPCALTLVAPLIDVDQECGPTGIAPGSHREAYGGDETLQPVELARGDLAVWDFRVMHAGLENRSDRLRPVIYFTACRPFWIDHKNFIETARVRLTGDPAKLAELGPRFARAKPLAPLPS